MKTQKTKLVFSKNSVVELKDLQTKRIFGGGSTYVCSNCIPDPISDMIRETLKN